MPGKGLEPLRANCTLEPESSLSTKFQHPGTENTYSIHRLQKKVKLKSDVIFSKIYKNVDTIW